MFRRSFIGHTTKMVAASLIVPRLGYSAIQSFVCQEDCDFFLQLIGAKKVGFDASNSEIIQDFRIDSFLTSGYKICSSGPRIFQDFLLIPMRRDVSQHTLDNVILAYRKSEEGVTYSHTISRGYLAFCRSHFEASKYESKEKCLLSHEYFPVRIVNTGIVGELSHDLTCGSLRLRHIIESANERVLAIFETNGVELWRRDYVISTCIHSTSIS